MIYQGKDVKLIVGGEEIKGIRCKEVVFSNEPIKPDESWPVDKIEDSFISCQLLLGPKACWFFKNDLFIKNRPPRGMQRD